MVKIKRKRGEAREGVVGIRAPDGSVVRTIRFCTDDILPPNANSDPEDVAMYEPIIRDMAKRYHQYIREAANLEKKKEH